MLSTVSSVIEEDIKVRSEYQRTTIDGYTAFRIHLPRHSHCVPRVVLGIDLQIEVCMCCVQVIISSHELTGSIRTVRLQDKVVCRYRAVNRQCTGSRDTHVTYYTCISYRQRSCYVQIRILRIERTDVIQDSRLIRDLVTTDSFREPTTAVATTFRGYRQTRCCTMFNAQRSRGTFTTVGIQRDGVRTTSVLVDYLSSHTNLNRLRCRSDKAVIGLCRRRNVSISLTGYNLRSFRRFRIRTVYVLQEMLSDDRPLSRVGHVMRRHGRCNRRNTPPRNSQPAFVTVGAVIAAP